MIREDDLREAIAECEGIRNPSASTCIKLASFYTLLDHMSGRSDPKQELSQSHYSYASRSEIPFGSSAFSKMVEEKGIESCFPIIEETMEAMSLVVPKLYQAMMRKLDSL